AARFPWVDVIPVTVSLTGGPEPTINRMIRRSLGRDVEFEANRRRNRFNRRLVDEYSGRHAVFDLARLESTRPDGTRAFDYDGGEVVYSLAPEYADNDTRLTGAAQRMLGEQLLVFLAGLPLPSRELVATRRGMATA
ncbi:MAG TPA: hypothetical protein VH277_09025, partial [Gemmatimonadaceae bacterium]|nr:hypothetical protein [Gemmatimonadaceae bacterium]